jgi:hypothetical protein
MLRLIVPTAAILLASSFTAQAASLSEQNLNRELRNVAAQSSVGTPRAISEDILDQGFTVEGTQLINHLSVQKSHADKMRADPKAVYFQLGASVCNNPSFRKLMAKGAIMRYDFTEVKTNKAIGSASYQESDCPKAGPGEEEVVIANWRAVVHPRRAVRPARPVNSANGARRQPSAGSTPLRD